MGASACEVAAVALIVSFFFQLGIRTMVLGGKSDDETILDEDD